MRIVLAALIALLIGFVTGWSMRDKPVTVTKYVYRDVPVPPKTTSAPAKTTFPTIPKPPLTAPKPEEASALVVSNRPIPSPLVGDLPRLPSAGGPIAPVMPVTQTPVPTADLNADEALTRRLVLSAGGEIVSSSDAKDSTGKVGVSLIAETPNGAKSRLQASLRRALGDRAILSDAGFVGGSTPEIRKAEDALSELRKKRDQARIDFMPNAPTLLDIEDEYRQQEKTLGDLKRSTARQRLNIFIRPVLGA